MLKQSTQRLRQSKRGTQHPICAYNSPHNACEACMEDATAHMSPATDHIEAVTVPTATIAFHIEDATTHTAPATAHTEITIAPTEIETAHMAPATAHIALECGKLPSCNAICLKLFENMF